MKNLQFVLVYSKSYFFSDQFSPLFPDLGAEKSLAFLVYCKLCYNPHNYKITDLDIMISHILSSNKTAHLEKKCMHALMHSHISPGNHNLFLWEK